jgi:hypothetical protein
MEILLGLNMVLYLAGVYCECPAELLRISTKSFHAQELSRFLFFGLCITLYYWVIV